MSQENVELTRRAFEAANRRELEGFLALMDPEVEAHPRIMAMQGGFRGHDGIRSWWDDLLGFLPDVELEIRDVRDLGDVALAVLQIRGHGAGSATPVDEAVWSASRWRDGLCVWWGNYGSEAEAREALSLQG